MDSRGFELLCHNMYAQQMLQRLVVHNPDEDGYSLKQGVIRRGQQIWVRENSAFRTKTIAALHDSSVRGH